MLYQDQTVFSNIATVSGWFDSIKHLFTSEQLKYYYCFIENQILYNLWLASLFSQFQALCPKTSFTAIGFYKNKYVCFCKI